MITFQQINKHYPNGTEAIKDFSLKINEGEITTLIGPSGCGKTTTLKMINRLIEPTSGSIYINDRLITDYKLHELRWNIGYVLQDIALFPHMTIGENIAVVPEMMKWKKHEINHRTEELLHMVGMDPSVYQNRMPSELSGGQKQRIGVIRALAADPDIILMDEPFSALDPISRQQLQQDIYKLQRDIKKTIVFVTHDMKEALSLGDSVCLMQAGEIVQAGTAQDLIEYPKTDVVKAFTKNHRSPWLTSVGEVAYLSHDAVISKFDYEQGNFSKQGIYIISGENNQYMGAVIDGSPAEIAVLPEDMPLKQAVSSIEKSEQEFFPVISDNQLTGILTYKDIVIFLKNNGTLEHGTVIS